MSEFKGTIGKWELTNNEYFNEVIIKEPNLKSVCAVNINLKEVKHNALLISKAPELLEMLKECKLQLEYLNEKFTETGTTNSLLSKIESLVKQATEL